MYQRMNAMVRSAQDALCETIEHLDGDSFSQDEWQFKHEGGGRSRVLSDGRVFEKAGVNVSAVAGPISDRALVSLAGGRHADVIGTGKNLRFRAVGLSVVMHPHNPMAPTAHCNFRYCELTGVQGPDRWWFGGGADLTPAYLFEDDARDFHTSLKTLCDAHNPQWYPRFKKQCDEYFFIPHRQEARGIGGIFFDAFDEGTAVDLFPFMEACTQGFGEAYLPIVRRRADMPYTEQHKQWQGMRRGRYVEFNLVNDRGTAFGLQTAGKVENVLMSLPLTARWQYAHVPAAGSAEATMLEVLRSPREWV